MPSAVSSGNGPSAFSGLFGAASMMTGSPYIDRVERHAEVRGLSLAAGDDVETRPCWEPSLRRRVAELKQQPGKDLIRYDT